MEIGLKRIGRKPRFTTDELIGRIFGNLKVISEAEPFTRGKSNYYKCSCQCGETKDIAIQSLLSGKSESCGRGFCNHNSKHGLSYTKEYELYQSIKGRCYTPKATGYEYYGAIRINMCDRWLGDDGFVNFFGDMGKIPSGMSIDRIDPTKGYSPDNCRWANQSLQSYNTRKKVTNTSGRTGVGFYDNRWVATITKGGKQISLGSYHNFEEAVHAREQAELKYFGFNKE